MKKKQYHLGSPLIFYPDKKASKTNFTFWFIEIFALKFLFLKIWKSLNVEFIGNDHTFFLFFEIDLTRQRSKKMILLIL